MSANRDVYLTHGRFFLYDDGTVESCVHEHQAFGPADERDGCHRDAEREIEPHIYRTQAEAESAAETLAFRTGKETGIYRLSDAACVSMWLDGGGHVTRFDRVIPALPFRPDGSSWLDAPAEAKP